MGRIAAWLRAVEATVWQRVHETGPRAQGSPEKASEEEGSCTVVSRLS